VTALLRDRRLPAWLLAAACVAMIPVLFFLQRGTLLWADALAFVVYHDGWSLDAMLLAHNGQFMPTTWLAFNLDSALFHPGASGIPKVVSIASQIALVWGIFVWSRRRVDPWIAAALALLILTYGAGNEVITWSFNFGWTLALAAGAWALIVNDGATDSTRNRLAVAGLLALSLSGDNLGVVFCVAIGSQIFFRGSRARAIWIVGPLLALWVLWYLKYAVGMGVDSGFHPKVWPYASLKLIETTFNGFVFDMVGWGAPLALLGVGVIAWRMWSVERLNPKLLTALALPLTFIAMIVVTRSNSDPAVSRYKYTLAVYLVFLFAEVLRGASIPRRLGPFLTCGVIVLFLAAGNMVWMATGAKYWRGNADVNRLYYSALAQAGRDVACGKTTFDPPDPLMLAQHNCLLYDEMVAKGGHQISAADLAKQPGAEQQVKKWATELREYSP
jgi:hypothetical protein